MAVVHSTDNDFQKYLQDNEIVAVKFYADWCGNCKLFSPKYKRVSGEEGYEDVKFLEVDAENNPEARKKAGVDNLPFLAIFKDGELLDGSASSKEDYLRELLEKAKNGS